MRCLQPIRLINPHYKKLACDTCCDPYDFRDRIDYYIDVPCGLCVNCLETKKSNWRIRLLSEYRYSDKKTQDNTLYFTFTFKDKYVKDAETNPHKYVRSFCENYRRYFGVSPRHYFVTEYGEQYGRFHMHGLIFGSLTNNRTLLEQFWSDTPPPRRTLRNLTNGSIKKYWSNLPPNYGFIKFTRLGNVPRTAQSSPGRVLNYIACYISKYIDKLVIDKTEKQKVFVSPGIGKSYADDPDNIRFAKSYKDGSFKFNLSSQGFHFPYQLPRYFRNKLYTDDEQTIIKRYFRQLTEDQQYVPPFRIGKHSYDDIFTYSRFAREQGLKCDLDFKYLYYLKHQKNG